MTDLSAHLGIVLELRAKIEAHRDSNNEAWDEIENESNKPEEKPVEEILRPRSGGF